MNTQLWNERANATCHVHQSAYTVPYQPLQPECAGLLGRAYMPHICALLGPCCDPPAVCCTRQYEGLGAIGFVFHSTHLNQAAQVSVTSVCNQLYNHWLSHSVAVALQELLCGSHLVLFSDSEVRAHRLRCRERTVKTPFQQQNKYTSKWGCRACNPSLVAQGCPKRTSTAPWQCWYKPAHQ
jgi:hypothetical protein